MIAALGALTGAGGGGLSSSQSDSGHMSAGVTAPNTIGGVTIGLSGSAQTKMVYAIAVAAVVIALLLLRR